MLSANKLCEKAAQYVPWFDTFHTLKSGCRDVLWERLCDSPWVPSCPPRVWRMLRGWTESHPICPRTTCREGPRLICLPAALRLALCHILKWIRTVKMSPLLSLCVSPPSFTVSTLGRNGTEDNTGCLQIWQEDIDNDGATSDWIKNMWLRALSMWC